MYASSVPDFINSLVPYDNSDRYVGMLKWSNYSHMVAFNKDIKDTLKNYDNYYICVYNMDVYSKFHKYIDIDISFSLCYFKYCNCALISNDNYMLYKLSNI